MGLHYPPSSLPWSVKLSEREKLELCLVPKCTNTWSCTSTLPLPCVFMPWRLEAAQVAGVCVLGECSGPAADGGIGAQLVRGLCDLAGDHCAFHKHGHPWALGLSPGK
jgi:hypothetical protein